MNDRKRPKIQLRTPLSHQARTMDRPPLHRHENLPSFQDNVGSRNERVRLPGERLRKLAALAAYLALTIPLISQGLPRDETDYDLLPSMMESYEDTAETPPEVKENLEKKKLEKVQSDLSRRYTPRETAAWLKSLGWKGELENLNRIQNLNLSSKGLNDQHLAHVRNIPSLISLSLAGNPIQGEGLHHLSQHRHLKRLDLSDTLITDSHSRMLGKLTFLDDLYLDRTSAGDETMHTLNEIPNLRTLKCYACPVTNRGAAHIGKMKSLTSLLLSYTAITDEGAAELKSLSRLKYLDLSGTGISDSSLYQIRRLKQLEFLGIYNTAITENGLRMLKVELPETKVFWR